MYYNYPRQYEPIRENDERFAGALLPFLAGVAVTSPLVFFAKNQQPCCGPQPIIYPPMQQPMPYYPYQYPYQPYPYR